MRMKKKVRIEILLTCFLLLQMVSYFPVTCPAAESVSTESADGTDMEVTDLDLGDYQTTMAVGEKQLLTVTPLPASTVSQTVTYTSGDENVAKINAMGRITAMKPGTTVISVICQEVTEKFTLTVTEASAGSTETDTTVAVTDIEIADHEDELEVDKTLTLSVTVLPSTATDATVSYSSSNPAVATVSSTGEVKGIAPGNVQITVMAGTVMKAVPLVVKIATTAIDVSSTYVVLKSGESCQLTAHAEPTGASQSMTYSCVDTEIASVSAGGLITAKQTGSTTVLVSNGDMSNSVTVIVNTNTGTETEAAASASASNTSQSTAPRQENSLINSIRIQEHTTAEVEDCPLLTKDMLKALYESGNTLELKAADYTLMISGEDIVNYENELDTRLTLKNEKGKISFALNGGDNLPGMVTLKLNTKADIKYIYLYNTVKEKYEKLSAADMTTLSLDTPGKYLLTEAKLRSMSLSILFLAAGVVALAALIVSYILIKKKYWFW